MMLNFQKAEQIYIPPDTGLKKQNLEEYITNNFQLPDNDLKRICEFVHEDPELEDLIYNLKDIVKTKLDLIKDMQINFYPEFQEEELVLEIQVLTDLGIDDSLKVERKIDKILYKKYSESTTDKILFYITDIFD